MNERHDGLVDERIVEVERHGADYLEFGLPTCQQIGLKRVGVGPGW